LPEVAKEADADAEFLLCDNGFLVLDAGVDARDAVFVADVDLLVVEPKAGMDGGDERIVSEEQLSADAAYVHFLAKSKTLTSISSRES